MAVRGDTRAALRQAGKDPGHEVIPVTKAAADVGGFVPASVRFVLLPGPRPVRGLARHVAQPDNHLRRFSILTFDDLAPTAAGRRTMPDRLS